MIVRVVLPVPLDQAFSYHVPEKLAAEVQAGCRVLVPFGRRRLTGLVVGNADPAEVAAADYTLKDVLDVLDERPAFTDEMLRLTRWIADYYVCGWGEVVKAALPTGSGVELKQRVVRTEAPVNGHALSAAGGAVLRYLDDHGEASVASLRQAVSRVTSGLLEQLEEDGLVTLATDTVQRVQVKTEKHVRLAPALLVPGAVKDAQAQLRGNKQVAVLGALHAFTRDGTRAPRQADVLARAEAAASTLHSLERKGLVEVVEQEVLRSPLGDLPAPEPAPARTLHPAQADALEEITDAVGARRFEAFLLHGITGSGKTEVYIAALKAVRAQGKSAIVLVPEIALTPQTVQRFRSHFGDQIAVLHSRMSLGERYDTWRALRRGRYPIVIGPRSAVLAPVQDLGLVVVDEEHEPSYKQFDPAPRYHARDVAVMRAHMNDAVCVLGSATPSVESYANARGGKYTLLPMPERVPVPGRRAAPLPEVAVIDLTLEKKKHRLDGAISVPLREAIQARLDREEQIILLQNRRGYSPVIECDDCGWSPTCRDCAVTLTYHKVRRQLRCHYCGLAERMPPRCPECGSDALGLLGAGTQRVEEELERLFPAATVVRMDLDTTGRKNAHHKILSQFERGEADILLGTQMVAKGLDFGRVTLVGAINADAGMLLPDFRAEERTFQLLTQVAGRAGRADRPGEVLLQTRNPDHTVIRYARRHDYLGFVEHILPERHALGYPPYGRIVGVEFRGPDRQAVDQLARRWTTAFRQRAAGLEVLGPEQAFIGRIKRQFRVHTIIKVPRSHPMPAVRVALHAATEQAGTPPKGSRLAIDVDAVGLF